jgi:hypothetical protein
MLVGEYLSQQHAEQCRTEDESEDDEANQDIMHAARLAPAFPG